MLTHWWGVVGSLLKVIGFPRSYKERSVVDGKGVSTSGRLKIVIPN